jgi:hypothetical protein
MVGVGFTVMVKVWVIPGQFKFDPVKIGWTVRVEVIGAFVAFIALNTGILPDPLATSPILVTPFVQL